MEVQFHVFVTMALGGKCGTNEGEEERVKVIDRKARGKETTRKTET
jgi:hypothetical protein